MTAEPIAHPLEPLTAPEFRATAAILRRDQAVGESWRFASIELIEPAKAEVVAWRTGDPIPRRSLSVLWDRRSNQTYEAVVDLVGDRVDSWNYVPGVTPNFTVDEFHEVDDALHQHPGVLAVLAERGISDPSLVLFDVWTYGQAVMPEQWQDRRLGWCDLWLRESPGGNPYAHPVSGLKIIVDLNTLEVLDIEDHHDYGRPDVDGEYDPRLRDHREQPRAQAAADQPARRGLVPGRRHEVHWQNWSLRLGFNFREGLVLHQVGFNDHGTRREIAYRMSFAEMVVPYRDPGFDHYRRTAFDIGEWGLGNMVTSLELGCDCLGEIVYLDAVIADSRGEPEVITQAICLHEEDAGVLWKHVDSDTGAQTRRMRRMVISVHATVANYEYLIYWRFYADGNIECEVRATGLMVTTPLAAGARIGRRTARWWTTGRTRRSTSTSSSPSSTWTSTEPRTPCSRSTPWRRRSAPDNPYGLALINQATKINSERESARDYSWEKPAGLEGDQPEPDQPARRPSRLQTGARRGASGAVRSGGAGLSTRPGDRPLGLGHRVRRRRALARRGLSDPVGTGLQHRAGRTPTRHQPLGPRRRAVGRPTSCSGTSSASTTSPGPRTGRSCPPTRSPSGSSRSASSIRIRRWTSRIRGRVPLHPSGLLHTRQTP